MSHLAPLHFDVIERNGFKASLSHFITDKMITQRRLFRAFTTVFVFLIILLSSTRVATAQFKAQKYVSYGEIYNSGNEKVELLVNMSSTPCAQQNTQNKFKLKMTGIKAAYDGRGYYLNWKMRVVQCNGDILIKNFGISLDINNIEGENDAMDWEFPGQSIELPIRATISNRQNNDKDQIVQNIKSIVPKSILGDSIIVTGDSVILKVLGGVLGTNAQWVWRKDSCTGTLLGTGPAISITPTEQTTRFFVRAESPTDTSACIYKDVYIDDASRLTTSAKIMGINKLCNSGKSERLELGVIGGRKGYKAEWVWYKDSCGSAGAFLGRGDKIVDSIEKTTVYYARLEGIGGTTACLSHTVVVTGFSSPPASIEGPSEICEGENFSLKVKGGALAIDPNAKWYWSSSPDFQTRLDSGSEINLVASKRITSFYVRAEGTCNTTGAQSKFITVKTISVSPYSIIANQLKAPNGRLTKEFNLKLSGGSLGDDAMWEWYKKSISSGNLLQKGTESEIKKHTATKGDNNIFVLAKGICNTTEPISVTINYKKQNTPNRFHAFLNAGSVDPQLSNLVFTIGTRDIYIRRKQYFGGGTVLVSSYNGTPSGLTDFPINNISYYEFTGNQIVMRSSFTGGFLFGLSGKGKKKSKIGSFTPTSRIYLGGGIGKVTPLMELNEIQYTNSQSQSKWALNTANAINGPEFELGLYLRFGHFNIMGGTSMILGKDSKKYFDTSIGIGFSIY